LTLARGQIRVTNHLMMGRLYHADNYGKRIGQTDMIDLLLNIDWPTIANTYVQLVVPHLVADGVSYDVAVRTLATVLCNRVERRLSHDLQQRLSDLMPALGEIDQMSVRAKLRKVPGLRKAVNEMRRLFGRSKPARRNSEELQFLCRSLAEAQVLSIV
jgi:hypothetical protein